MATLEQLAMDFPLSSRPAVPEDEYVYEHTPIIAPGLKPRQLAFPVTDLLPMLEVEGPLTRREIEGSLIPDQYLAEASIDFTEDGLRYRVTYSPIVKPKGMGKTFILLQSSPYEMSHFIRAKRNLWSVFDQPENNIDGIESPRTIMELDHFWKELTQRRVAYHSSRLKRYYPDAHVSLLVFREIPVSFYKKSGFSPEKVMIRYNAYGGDF